MEGQNILAYNKRQQVVNTLLGDESGIRYKRIHSPINKGSQLARSKTGIWSDRDEEIT